MIFNENEIIVFFPVGSAKRRLRFAYKILFYNE